MNVVDSCGWLEYFGNGPNVVIRGRRMRSRTWGDLVLRAGLVVAGVWPDAGYALRPLAPGIDAAMPHMLMTTLPRACPSPKWDMAS